MNVLYTIFSSQNGQGVFGDLNLLESFRLSGVLQSKNEPPRQCYNQKSHSGGPIPGKAVEKII
jgi:hypothetical protein